jgi:hypothetical protein
MIVAEAALAPDVAQPLDERREAYVTTAVAPSPKLSAVDRCDRCGARAYVRIELANGHDLLFCVHHAREHADKLHAVASAIHDETGALTTDGELPAGER